MEQEIFNILADKYLKGEASAEEARLVETNLEKLRTQDEVAF